MEFAVIDAGSDLAPTAMARCLVFVGADGRIQEFREYLAWPGGLAAGGDDTGESSG